MKRSRYSDEQIGYALRQAETGTAMADVCRQLTSGRNRHQYITHELVAGLAVTFPPATRTLPIGSSVAVCMLRTVGRLLAGDQEAVGGS
jgi:hypothetical protein